jgi:hypothetical protein
MADAFDVWRAGGPKIDFFAADIYSNDYPGFCARYAQSGNPLYIAETGGGGVDVKAKALYAFGRHDAMAFSPFGIDSMVGNPADPFGYDLISQIAPLILKHQGDGTMTSVLFGPKDPPKKIQLGKYTLEAGPTRPRGAPPAQAQGQAPPPQAPSSVAMFIATGPDEYYAIGRGVTVVFSTNPPDKELAGLGTVEEGKFVNGRWVPGRLLAGDDTEQGQYLDLRSLGILRFTLYRFH